MQQHRLKPGFQLDAFSVAPMSGLVTGPDGENRLEPRVMHVLMELALRVNKVAERRDLLASVWPNQVVLDENLSRAVSILRKVLGHAAIETVPKVGYRLVGNVRVLAEAATDGRTGIAVLPFLDLSPEGDIEYFADGLAEELLNLMTKIPALRVPARTSSFSFKGNNQDVRDIGATLNVDYLLEGSVRKSGERMRITTQLIAVDDGNHLWSETYDVVPEDIFAVQDEVAAAVVRQLNLRLLNRALPAAYRVDPEAWRLVLLGRNLMEKRTKESIGNAFEHFRQALALDPEYPLAWASQAKAHTLYADMGLAQLDQAYAQARQAAERALELDPCLPEANEALAWILWSHYYDWAAAETILRRAMETAPSNARVLNTLASVVLTLGRIDEAFELFDQALRSDPLNSAVYMNLGIAHLLVGRDDNAELCFRKILELVSETTCVHFCIARIYLSQNQPERALAEAQLEPEEGWRTAGMALAYHALHDEKKSSAMLAKLQTRNQEFGGFCFELACISAYRGEIDDAFSWLGQSYDARDGALCDAKPEPLLDNLRDDPRWQEFLSKLNLAD